MFEKAFSWLRGKNEAPSAPRPTQSAGLMDSVVKKVSGIVSGFFSSKPAASDRSTTEGQGNADSKEWRNRFYGKIAELKKLDSARFSAGSWKRFWEGISVIEADFDSGAASDPAVWLVSFRNAVDGLVEVAELRNLVKKAQTEAELADITGTRDRLEYYRMFSLADAVLFDPDVKKEHVETVSAMLRREFAKLALHPRVVRTRELRASFDDFRQHIESMNLRDYAVDGLKSLAVKYRTVIDATKDDSGADVFDQAVTDLFKSVSSLVPLGGLRDAQKELSAFLKTHPQLAKRWDLSRYSELSDLAKEAVACRTVTKKHVETLTAAIRKSLSELTEISRWSNELHALVTKASQLDSKNFSKASYVGVSEFVALVSATGKASDIPGLVVTGKRALERLVDLSRLKRAVLETDAVLKGKKGVIRHAWSVSEMRSRMELACSLIEEESPKKQKVEFVASILESFVLSAVPAASVDSLAVKFRRMVSSVMGDGAY